jgi:Tfp pilus assembly protein PilX
MKERGIALLVAIFALAVVGALVAAAFQIGLLEQRIGRNSVYAAEAAEAAEAGAALVLADWEAYPDIGALAVAESVTLARTRLGDHVDFQPTLVRLTDGLYLVRSQGTRTDAAGNVLAQRSVATLARTTAEGVVPLDQRSWVQVY